MKKHIIYLLLAALMVPMASFGHDFADEALTYKVMFKWGLINKQAGHATLRVRNVGDEYRMQLTAASEKWADRYYKVRDTLNGIVIKDGFQPQFYEKKAHEGSDHKHDIVRYSKSGIKTIGSCVRRKWDNDGNLVTDEKRTLEAFGTTVDMLSSFYYMRALPYPTWKKGHVVTLNIYSGKRKELLTIKYMGVEKVSYDKRHYECYRIQFIFTSDGRTRTSDDMDAWITTGPERIPVKLEGKLKVGKVRCFYTGD